jgi:hypothetical protein
MLERQAGKDGAGRFNHWVAIGIAVLLAAGTTAIVVQGLWPKAPEHPAWEGPGPEPAARAWAVRLEPSLLSACSDAFHVLRDKRAVIATISQQLGAQPITGPESQEVLKAIADRESFVRGCLVHAYGAIEPCAVHRADLVGAAARGCVAGALARLVWAVPYDLCSERVEAERLRRSCAAAADQARRHADETLRTASRL